MNLLELARAALLEAEQDRGQIGTKKDELTKEGRDQDGDASGTKEYEITKKGIGHGSQSDTPARRWRVHFPSLDPMEVIFAREATRRALADPQAALTAFRALAANLQPDS